MQKNSGETLKHCYPASLPLPLLFFLKTKQTHTDLPCKLWMLSTITSSVAVCVREWICSRLSQQDSRQWQQSSTPCCVTVTLMPIHTRSQQQRVTYAQSQWRRRRWFLLSPLFDSRPLCHYESCSPYSNGRRCRSASDTMSCTQLFWVTCTIYTHWCFIDYFPLSLIHHFNILFVFNYSF